MKERVAGKGGHPHQPQLALEVMTRQLCEVWRPSTGASGTEVTTRGQHPESEKGRWSKPPQPLGFPTLLPSHMADTGVEGEQGYIPLWEGLWVPPAGCQGLHVFPSPLPVAP